MIINYIVHNTTTDNEKGLASGHSDCDLSALGIKQSLALFEKIKASKHDFGEIFSSNLIRAQKTANTVFPNKEIIYDARLREIDFGVKTLCPKSFIEENKNSFIKTKFENGESYSDVEDRVRDFLNQHSDKRIITIVAHQAPQIALACICNNLSWQEAFDKNWRSAGEWQPFWRYELKN